MSDGFQLLKRERERVVGVLRSSEGVRAALDEERDAVARPRGRHRATGARGVARGESRVARGRRWSRWNRRRGGEENATVRISPPPRSSRRLAGNLRSMGATPGRGTRRIESRRRARRGERIGGEREREARVAEPRARANGETSPRKTPRDARAARGGDGGEPQPRARDDGGGSTPPGTRPDVDRERTREDQLATTTYALSLPPPMRRSRSPRTSGR